MIFFNSLIVNNVWQARSQPEVSEGARRSGGGYHLCIRIGLNFGILRVTRGGSREGCTLPRSGVRGKAPEADTFKDCRTRVLGLF